MFLFFTPCAISPANNIIVGRKGREYDSGAPALSPEPNIIVEKESQEYGLYQLNMGTNIIGIETKGARAPNTTNFNYNFDITKGKYGIEYGTGVPIPTHNIMLKCFEKEREGEVGFNNDLFKNKLQGTNVLLYY